MLFYGKIYDYFEHNKHSDEFDNSDVIIFEAVGWYDENIFTYGLDKLIDQFNL